MLGEDHPKEFDASPQAEDAGVDLESARAAYQKALEALLVEFPKARRDKAHQTREMKLRSPLENIIRFPWVLLVTVINIPLSFLRELWGILTETADDLGALLGDKSSRKREAQKSERAAHLQHLVLEALWARDYVQYVLEQPEPVPYHIKRNTLRYLIDNDDLLDMLRRKAMEEGDLNPIQLRKAQPTPPETDAWWWFMDNRRIRRARRTNAFWFAAAIVPALAAIILITLLTQRLAIDGPDVLSGASALAQLVLGAGSVLAGRELLNMFFFDRSSGRSWQGEATFVLATLFMVVVAGFYLFAPPSAATVYNWFGQQAIKSGNAAEAELYLESAARLDPDPHAGNLMEVGCLYLTFGSRDRSQSVFERVLEADSRLLLARYHLAEIYIDQGEYDKARQLVNDGINLLTSGRSEFEAGESDEILPRITSDEDADKIEYLLKLSLGRGYLAAGENQSAKQVLAEANQIYARMDAAGIFAAATPTGAIEIPCTFEGDLMDIYIEITELDLQYLLANTYDAICQTEEDDTAAKQSWNIVARSKPYNIRQETYRAEGLDRIHNVESCTELISNEE